MILLYCTYRGHGGMMWNVKPELLLDYQSYQQWIRDVDMSDRTCSNPESEKDFSEMSEQAWTHILMQIVKVCVNKCIFTVVVNPW